MENLFSYYIQVSFLSLIIINHLVELYLAKRQLAILKQNIHSVPNEFNSYLNLENHQKAIMYGSAKLQLSQFKLIWKAALLMYWFPFRGAEHLYQSIPLEGIHHEVFFLLSFFLAQYLLNLPWSIYQTFVLENRFEFNRMTPKLFLTDQLKGIFLGGVIFYFILMGLIFIFNTTGQWWWVLSFLLLTCVQLVLVWLYPTLIAPLFNKFTPLSGDELRTGIERLVTKAGLHAEEIFIMDASKRSSHGNAYFTGLGKNKRVVFFDTLIKHLNNHEIFAILAHELGHMKLKHIQKSLFLSLIFSFIGFWVMGKMSSQQWFYNGHFLRILSPGSLFFIFMEAMPVYFFWFQPLSSWISRRREFEADAYSAKETNSQDLVTGLLKLYEHNASPVITDKLYSLFYHSHPPALERIRKLQSIIK
jgi:STE24 endopeptidase